MIYTMCKYTPAELFAGFGQETVRLEASGDQFDVADSLGHANLCGYGKGLLEAAMAPEVQEMVLVNCCDVVRRIYDILKKNKQMKFLYLIDLPHKTDRADLWMMSWQLKKLIAAYESYSGISFDQAAFEAALKKEWERAETTYSELETGSDKNDNPENRDGHTEGSYISMVGAHSGTSLPTFIAKHFSVEVRDETCSANRKLESPHTKSEAEGLQDSNEELLDLYAVSLLGQTPCMRMKRIEEREELGAGAAGIIYHTMKFCDYYGFEYAKKAEEQKVPLLKIETDATDQSEGQLATRLDAFAESLHLAHRSEKTMRDGAYTAGIDSGSSSTDVVIMDADKKIVAWTIQKTGAGAANGAERALEDALQKAGISRDEIGRVVTTGYGRETIGIGDDSVTEITCHAKGAHYLYPSVRTIIDIGGQDSKVIKVDADGNVLGFVMNDKCAAGTGRFLEMMARTMEMSLEEMSQLGLKWKEDVSISSMCTVFAESEVVSLIAKNVLPADIVHGLNRSVSNRTAALVKRVGGEPAYMMTGGVARNEGVVDVLSEKLGTDIFVSEYSQLCGAIGAALL